MDKPYIQFPDLQYTEEGHRYHWKRVEHPSVTHVLSSVARKVKGEWVPIADNRFFQEDGGVASAFGQSFHKAAALTLRNIAFDCPDDLRPWHDQFLRWRKDYAFLRPLRDSNGVPLIEYPMYHAILGYCGTGDLFAESVEPCPARWRNTVWCLDWKTSTQEAAYWLGQTAGYEELLRHVFPDLVRGRKLVRCAVRFEADRFFPDTRMNHPEDKALFLSSLNIYNS